MATIEHIKSARTSKRPRYCDFPGCDHAERVIQPGESYKRFSANRFATTLIRHDDHPDWTPGERETTKLATALLGQEAAEAALDDIDPDSYITDDATGEARYNADGVASDIESILSDASDAAQDCADDYQEGIDNLPDSLQYSSPAAEQAQERVDAMETWQGELDGYAVETEWDVEDHEGEDTDDVDDAFRSWVTEQVDNARELVYSLEI